MDLEVQNDEFLQPLNLDYTSLYFQYGKENANVFFLNSLKKILYNNINLEIISIPNFLKQLQSYYQNNIEDKEQIKIYYKIFFQKYNDLLPKNKKLLCLFQIPIEESAENYILQNYESLKEEIKNIVFVYEPHVDCIDDEFGLENYRIDFTLKYNKDLNIIIIPNNEIIIYLLYKYFQNEICYLNSEGFLTKYPYTLLKKLTIKHFVKICLTLNNEDINNMVVMKNFIKIFALKNESICKYIVENKLPNSNEFINFIFNTYSLQTLKDQELKKSLIYLQCFQFFLTKFFYFFDDSLNKQDIYTLEIIFRRSVKNGNPCQLFNIENKKAMYYNYRSNEIDNHLDIDLAFIKQYNHKHFINLRNNFSSTNLSLKLLNILGYQNSLTLLKNCPIHFVDEIISILEKKDSFYYQCFIKILNDQSYRLFTHENFSITAFDYFLESYIKKYEKMPTTNKILKRLNSEEDTLLFPNNKVILGNLKKLDLVKKGSLSEEKIKGILLYEAYRKRILSSIPDYHGKIGEIEFEFVDMHSPEIISNGIDDYILPNNKIDSSCLTPNGKASSSLNHGATNVHGRFFKVTYQNQILAYSWVWRAGNILCFDNIEITKKIYDIQNYEEILYQSYKQTADEMIKNTSIEKNDGIKLVVIGRNKVDVSNKFIDALENILLYQTHTYKPDSIESLYLEDSKEKQVIIAGNFNKNLSTKNVEPIYLYTRSLPQSFDHYNKSDLEEKLNSIYFDYCISNNHEYQRLNNKYCHGYIGQDWFIGFKNHKDYDFYYVKNDERLFKEAMHYIPKILKIEKTNIPIIKPKEEKLEYILNKNNYTINHEKIKYYIDSFKHQKYILQQNLYTHTTSSFEKLAHIFETGITSNKYGGRNSNGGYNGKNFISIAKINTTAFHYYLKTGTILLDSDMCTFGRNILNTHTNLFTNTTYPIRNTIDGEYQVLHHISIEKFKALFSIDILNFTQLSILISLMELYEVHIPIIDYHKEVIIEPIEIKKYIKLNK